jgi:ABC-type multidrug transport system fused ATPase/permease subunit
MGIDGIGSSVVIALAAVLWFLYLVPTWLKRREYLATERNAVRLQQTMRIMAESAELPSVVRVEATARTAAAQERALRKQQRRRATAQVFDDDRRLTSARSARIETPLAARRLRRSRALATLVLLASLVAAGFGVSALATSGSWVLLAASVVVAVGALALLGQAAAVSRARAELRRAANFAPVVSALHDRADYAEERRPGWTPVPIPRPLYLSRAADDRSLNRATIDDRSLRRAQPVSKGATEPFDHAAALRAASAEAERALRAAQDAPEVTRIERLAATPVAPAAQSRFARMGLVDTKDAAPADLDEILRRRRAVG